VNKKFKLLAQLISISLILLSITLLVVALLGKTVYIPSVLTGYAISLANMLFALYSLTWAFDKPNNTFFSVVLGGMGIRFVFLGAALFFVWKFTQVPFLAFVVSLVGFYLTLQIFEIRIFQKKLNSRKAAI
jgi:hypothetical protein